jgi:hypothetical protein
MQSSSIADTQDSRIQENTLMTKGALDPKRIVSGVVDILSPVSMGDTRLFILLGSEVPVGEATNLGSLFTTKGPFKELRYFMFSRDSRVMLEFTVNWERWKLSFDGTLEKASR